MILLPIIFLLSVAALLYSYGLYPLLLKWVAVGKKENDQVYAPDDAHLPEVCIIFSAYNEEKVIAEKLQSIFRTNYPANKLSVWIGSDHSADQTNSIINDYASRNEGLHFFPFTERQGKSKVLNKLVALVQTQSDTLRERVYIFTDANVMFTPDTIFQLVKHFKNKEVGQVAAHIKNRGVREDGISFQESSYIQRENQIKYLEGLNWGTMMGAFGACYAMRADCWAPLPANTLMEDFYLSMNVLKTGFKAIKEMDAICLEDVSNDMEEEFKRKTRIQAGNFQNLKSYWHLLFQFNATSFCFFSHKFLRWMGPLFILCAWASNLGLLLLINDGGNWSRLFLAIFIAQSLLLISPLIEKFFRNFGMHFKLLRFAAYFYLMNLALVKGAVMYFRGVKTSAWNPTKRNLT